MTCKGRNRIYPQGAWGQPCGRISQVSLFHPAAKHWTSGTSSEEHTPKQALTITKKIGIMMSFIATSYLKHLCFWARTGHADHEYCMAEAGTCSGQGGPAGSDPGWFHFCRWIYQFSFEQCSVFLCHSIFLVGWKGFPSSMDNPQCIG